VFTDSKAVQTSHSVDRDVGNDPIRVLVATPSTYEAAAATPKQTRHRSTGRNDDDGIRSRHASRGRPKMVNFY
jgi:hypothetical protein